MKSIRLIIFIIFSLLSVTGKAQNYTVNIPVYDTIIPSCQLPIKSSPVLCEGGRIWIDEQLFNSIAGVDFYLKFLPGLLPNNSLININTGDTLNIGDSLLITNNDHDFILGSYTYTGNIDYTIIAIGTPTQPNDSFFCKSEISGTFTFTPGGCIINTVWQLWHCPFMQNCFVTIPLIIKENTQKELVTIQPNPFIDKLKIVIEEPYRQIYLYDMPGRLLLTSKDIKKIEDQLLSAKEGIYTIQIDFGDCLKTFSAIKK